VAMLPSVLFTLQSKVDGTLVFRQSSIDRFSKLEVPGIQEIPASAARQLKMDETLVQWAQATQLTVELVYYPPYHSKYNPIERCWGVLEVYWNGELLDSEEAVLGFAANMTYAGRHPHVDRVSAAYCSGVRRSSAEKKLLEGRLMRQPSLPKWSVTIAPPKPDEIILPA